MNETTMESEFYRYGSLVCSMAMVPVGAFGVVGNMVAACVFAQQRRRFTSPTSSPSPFLSAVKSRSSINILLIALTVVDTALLILATPLFSTIALYNFEPDTSGYLLGPIAYMTLIAYTPAMMAQCASVWIILVISLERYAAVVHPLSHREHGNVKKTKITLVAVILGAIAYNGCRFGEYQLNEHANSTSLLLRADRTYVDVYINWSYFVLVFALPFVVLLIVNTLIAKTIFQARRQRQVMLLTQRNLREHRTALMMAAVVLAYIACNVLALVLNAWEAVAYAGGGGSPTASLFWYQLDTQLFRFLSDFNNLLIQTHSSLTFLVYFRFSGHFRQFVRERCRLVCTSWKGCRRAANIEEEASPTPRKRTESASINYVRSRSTSFLTTMRKYSTDMANRYRKSRPSNASMLSSSSALERKQSQRFVQLIVHDKMALGLKRRAFVVTGGDSVESQLDPFYV